jgi:hypothetical protein
MRIVSGIQTEQQGDLVLLRQAADKGIDFARPLTKLVAVMRARDEIARNCSRSPLPSGRSIA